MSHGEPGDAAAAGTIEARLGVTFADRALLGQALVHRSYAFEAGGLPTNERLEFLGDAVLGLLITDTLYHLLPDEPEGRLAKIRAATVNTQRLASVARALGIGAAVKLGRGEELSGGRNKDSILADAFEALLGAVYIDQGLGAARALVDRLFGELLEDISRQRESLDYKTSLQELSAAAVSALPVYVVSEEGPDHAKQFSAEVSVAGHPLGWGTGRNKKEAEQAAAQQAYAALQERLALSSAPAGRVEPGEDGGRA